MIFVLEKISVIDGSAVVESIKRFYIEREGTDFKGVHMY